MSVFLGVVAFVAFMAFGVFQLYAGFVGIDHSYGSFWAWAALIAAMPFRFTLPITIGAFFCAMNVWGWHWAWAALFALPGLLFIIPGVFASILSLVKR